jgi:hypothetical protein
MEKEIIKIMEEIKKLVKENPNDYDLGSAIRSMVNDLEDLIR